MSNEPTMTLRAVRDRLNELIKYHGENTPVLITCCGDGYYACPECSHAVLTEPGCIAPHPLSSEVHGDDTIMFLCNECAQQIAFNI